MNWLTEKNFNDYFLPLFVVTLTVGVIVLMFITTERNAKVFSTCEETTLKVFYQSHVIEVYDCGPGGEK